MQIAINLGVIIVAIMTAISIYVLHKENRKEYNNADSN